MLSCFYKTWHATCIISNSCSFTFYDSPAVKRNMRFISHRMMPKTGTYRPPKSISCECTLSNIGRHVEWGAAYVLLWWMVHQFWTCLDAIRLILPMIASASSNWRRCLRASTYSATGQFIAPLSHLMTVKVSYFTLDNAPIFAATYYKSRSDDDSDDNG